MLIEMTKAVENILNLFAFLICLAGVAQYPSKNLPSSVTSSENKEHTLRASEETQNLPEPQEGNQMSDDSEESDLTESKCSLLRSLFSIWIIKLHD